MWPFSYLFRLHGVLFDTVFGGFDLYATRPKVELNCMEQYRIYLIYNWVVKMKGSEMYWIEIKQI